MTFEEWWKSIDEEDKYKLTWARDGYMSAKVAYQYATERAAEIAENHNPPIERIDCIADDIARKIREQDESL